MKKLALIITWLAILSAIGLMFTFVYWMTYNYKPLVFNQNPLPILNPNHQVVSGDYLDIQLDFCKYTTEIPEVSSAFVDDIIYQIAPQPANEKPVGCQKTILKVYVPKTLALGTYMLKRTYRYHPNPVKIVDVTIQTEPFTIIK